MSGLVKKVGKVFRKVGKVIRKRWKLIVIAIAVYFTAGIALSYFGSTAAFSTAMPGFGVGGIFSKAAVAIGFQGSSAVASGLSMTSGAFAAGTAAAGTIVPAGTLAAEAASVFTPVQATAGMMTGANMSIAPATASKFAAMGGTQAVAQGAAGGAGIVGGAAAGAAPMTAADAILKASSSAFKLQAASMLVSTVGGLFQEKQSDIDRKRIEAENAQGFGVGRDGSAESGWASSGGSDAFKDMGRPRVGPQPLQGAEQPSPYRAAMQSPTQAGAPFLPAPGGGQQTPAEGSRNEFIQKGYNQQGYMPYANPT